VLRAMFTMYIIVESTALYTAFSNGKRNSGLILVVLRSIFKCGYRLHTTNIYVCYSYFLVPKVKIKIYTNNTVPEGDY
jgi:hypothetical protein